MSDPRTITQTEAALLEKIAAEIVDKEVLAPMDAIDWGHGAPPRTEEIKPEETTSSETPPVVEPQKPETSKGTTPEAKPAEAATKSTTTVDIDWEALREPNGLILGKYKTEFEAIKGTRHVVEMAKSSLRFAEDARKEIEELRQKVNMPVPQPTPQPVSTQTPEVKRQSILDLAIKKIVDDGGIDETNADDLRTALESYSEELVSKMLLERDEKVAEEKARWKKVDDHMREKYPESANFVEELGLFIQADPALNEAVKLLVSQGKEIQASELAWKQFSLEQNFNTTTKEEITLDAADKVRQEAVAQARRDAGVMTTMASGVHESPAEPSTQEEIDAAAAEMQRTGLGERWRSLVFKDFLQDPVFNRP